MESPETENGKDKTDQKTDSRPPSGKKKHDAEEGTRPRSPGTMLFMLLIFALIGIWLFSRGPSGSKIDYNFLYTQVKDHDSVAEVVVTGTELSGKWRAEPPKDSEGEPLKETFYTFLPPPQLEDHALLPLLREKKVKVEFVDVSVGVGTQLMFWLVVPLLCLGFFWFMLRRSADPMSGGMMNSFIRSSAKRFQPTDKVTTFKDVAAMEQAKMDLEEIVHFLKEPTKFEKLGAEIPKGVLLMGPPGTGKTLLARATAGEAGVPFFSINGSEFIQMFVGVGASRVRDLFKTAKEAAPCIVFVDEIDAVGRVRGAGVGGGHDEREQTLNQILSEMDGFQATEAVIVIAATNRPDVLDPALMRPGRFDRHITVDRPTKIGRREILKVHSRKVPLADDVDLDVVAGNVIGFSGADLKNLVNEAALMASRDDKTSVGMEDFEKAHDRVLMGPEREDILTKRERRMTAYHEAGHAIVAWSLPDVDSVHKVTIIPRGRALGVTQLRPPADQFNIGESRLHGRLTMIMGGRAAEKLIFDEYSAGAEDDLNKATDTARNMVAHWGMSDVIGPVAFRQAREHPFLGKEIHEERKFSEETARIIDLEVQKLLVAASKEATEILRSRKDDLTRLTNELLDKESLDQADIAVLLGPKARHEDADDEDIDEVVPGSTELVP
ncbi:MAG: ATP-dependent zinc metalloprotease FtsH [Planctomycetota bacterium]|nr:ATP-dependent zinc metalloprotease FtsH [Planctomycetota bacterium]